jgi:sigma-B regulation protein RsbU (phosphoserine phosphatase)
MSQPVLNPLEAARTANRLRRILEAAKLLNSTIDLAELTAIILKIVRDELSIDRATVFVVDRDRNELCSLVAQDVSRNEIRLPLGSGIAGTVAVTGETMDIQDAYADRRFNPSFDVALDYRTRDIFSVPIFNRSAQTVGVLELLNRSEPFREDDLEFLYSVSVHIGLALENAWLHRQLLEKRKMERELALAREIQQNLCPALPRSSRGVQIAASSTMCEAVGGDYLDYYPLSNNRFVIMLGDVSGKGIGAALVMTSLHATCRALLRHVESLERIASILNESLIETTRAQTFVTFIALLVDAASRKVHCVRAGHLPPLVLDADGNSRWLEHGGGLPLGLFSDLKLTTEVFDVTEGTSVVLYTDGVTEAESAAAEHFGTARLNSIAKSHGKEAAANIHDAVRDSLKSFMDDHRQTDDTTLVVLKF